MINLEVLDSGHWVTSWSILSAHFRYNHCRAIYSPILPPRSHLVDSASRYKHKHCLSALLRPIEFKTVSFEPLHWLPAVHKNLLYSINTRQKFSTYLPLSFWSVPPIPAPASAPAPILRSMRLVRVVPFGFITSSVPPPDLWFIPWFIPWFLPSSCAVLIAVAEGMGPLSYFSPVKVQYHIQLQNDWSLKVHSRLEAQIQELLLLQHNARKFT